MIGATRTWAALALGCFERSPPPDERFFELGPNHHLGKPVSQIVNQTAPNIKRARRGDGTLRKPDPFAKKDGSMTIHSGGDPQAVDHLRIMPGWNYIVRLR